jgi:precorrin-6x reductase
MPTVVATHDVKDVDHWLSSPKREVFGPLGVTNIRTFVNPTDRSHVSISMDPPDMDALMAVLQADAGVAAMEYDGVLGETLVLYVQE